MKNGDYGIIGPLLLIGGPIAVTCFWPVMVWHGYGGPTGTAWRWDIHSTIAEAAYLGIIGFCGFLVWLGNRPATAVRPSSGRLDVEVMPPPPASISVTLLPACEHPCAGPLVNRFALSPVAWYCPECDTGLPREFGDPRRPCCGTRPGDEHWWNCVHAARWHELNNREG